MNEKNYFFEIALKEKIREERFFKTQNSLSDEQDYAAPI